MSAALGVGLHIVYGRMGAGKTNYVISEVLGNTTYNKCVLNVPLCPEYKDTIKNIQFVEFKKLEPEKVIRSIDEEHQDTLFIVDEAQMVLLSANKLLVDLFVKKMSQIRQNNQCVVVIAQISKMLPASIKDLAEDCYFFENNNVKGIDKSSRVKHYRTGYDYTSRIIETFTYSHVYGLYESTNTPTTEKPKNLYKRTYIKLALIFGVAALLFLFVGWKFYGFFSSFGGNEQVNNLDKLNYSEQVNNSDNLNNSEQVNDSLCVRSWDHLPHAIVHYVTNDGQIHFSSLSEFSDKIKCSLQISK